MCLSNRIVTPYIAPRDTHMYSVTPMSALKSIIGTVAATLLFCTVAQADIYKCTGDDGNLVFQQTPCVEKVPAEDEANASSADDRDVEEEGPTESTYATEVPASNDNDTSPLPGDTSQPEVIQLCKKKYRDAIDKINAEMSQNFSSEQGEAYRQRLRVLTRQLRAC